MSYMIKRKGVRFIFIRWVAPILWPAVARGFNAGLIGLEQVEKWLYAFGWEKSVINPLDKKSD